MKIIEIKLILLLFFFHLSSIFSQGVGVGTRIDLSDKLNLETSAGQFAQIFIPAYFSTSQDGEYSLVFHLHSASWAAENEVYKSNTNAILFNIHLGGFSSSYQNYFADQNNFQTILDLITTELIVNNIIDSPVLKRLIVTSFSAGYGGVREILKTQNYYDKIDALTLADGLHSNLEADIMREQMKDFLRFAVDSRDNKKIMLLTHSKILTYTYANTTETSDYLIANTNSERTTFNAVDEIGVQYSRVDTGAFHVYGYRGTTAEDHLKHLYNMHLLLKKAMDLLNRPTFIGNIDKDNDFCSLHNYPNPFNPSTTIYYSIGRTNYSTSSQKTILSVYNLLGEKLSTLVDELKSSGNYKAEFNGTGLSSGI